MWFRREYLVAMWLAFFIASCGCFCSAPRAFAEERRLPAGTVVDVQEEEPLILDVDHYLVERKSLDRANAAAETARRLEAELADCQQTVLESQGDGPGLWEWVAVGSAGFALGILAGAAL